MSEEFSDGDLDGSISSSDIMKGLEYDGSVLIVGRTMLLMSRKLIRPEERPQLKELYRSTS